MSTWPPIIPPATRTNATPQLDNHPSDHNGLATAITAVKDRLPLIVAGSPIGATSAPNVPKTVCTWTFPAALVGRQAMFVWQAVAVLTSATMRVEMKLYNPPQNFTLVSEETAHNVGGGQTIRTSFYVSSLLSTSVATYILTMCALAGADANGISTYSDPTNHQGYALVF